MKKADTHGSDLPLTVTQVANVHYFEFIERYQTKENTHSFCELLFIDRGSIFVQTPSYTGMLGNNQLLIHPPHEPHSLSCPQGIAPNVIIIDFLCDSPDLAAFSSTPVTLTAEQRRLLSEVMKEGVNLLEPPYDVPYTPKMHKRANHPYGAEQMLRLRLELFLLTLIREHLHQGEHQRTAVATGKTAQIHAYITEHYTEKILLDNLCFLFCTNKTSLCNDFRSEYGTTVAEYINSLRLAQAKELLRQNTLSVTAISQQLGFHSVHYFCRLFKKATGFTPKEYTSTILAKLNI